MPIMYHIPRAVSPIRATLVKYAIISLCTELSVSDDNILEYDETFTVRLSTGSNQVYITIGREQAEVIIREEDTDCEYKNYFITLEQPRYHR